MPVPWTQRSKWLSSCTQSLTGSTTAKRRHVTPHTRDQTEATDLRDPAKKDCAMFAWSVVTEMRYETCWNTPAISYACMCARMHARTRPFKSQTFCKGSECLKEDPTAGYYGMPGICWGNIALLVWACRAWSVWITLFHSPFSLTSVKRFNRMERKGGKEFGR